MTAQEFATRFVTGLFFLAAPVLLLGLLLGLIGGAALLLLVRSGYHSALSPEAQRLAERTEIGGRAMARMEKAARA